MTTGLQVYLDKVNKSLADLQAEYKALEQLKDLEEIISAVKEFLDDTQRMDEKYIEICDESDEDDNEPAGSCWQNEGWGAEFYVESSDWGTASISRQKLTTILKEKGLL